MLDDGVKYVCRSNCRLCATVCWFVGGLTFALWVHNLPLEASAESVKSLPMGI